MELKHGHYTHHMQINYWLQKWTIGLERQENQEWIKLETKELDNESG